MDVLRQSFLGTLFLRGCQQFFRYQTAVTPHFIFRGTGVPGMFPKSSALVNPFHRSCYCCSGHCGRGSAGGIGGSLLVSVHSC